MKRSDPNGEHEVLPHSIRPCHRSWTPIGKGTLEKVTIASHYYDALIFYSYNMHVNVHFARDVKK